MGQIFSLEPIEKPLTFKDLLIAVTDPNYHEDTEEEMKEKAREIFRELNIDENFLENIKKRNAESRKHEVD